jgi:spore maturation protein CgeB
MRIGIIGSIAPDRFAENINDALQRMGHQVTQLGPANTSHRSRHVRNAAMIARMAFADLDERAQRHIARTAKEAQCEVVINIDLRLMPDIVARIKRDGARVVFWFPDPVSQLGRQLMVLGPYDALYFKEPHIVDRLRSNLGLPAYYLPEACNPRWHRPLVPAGTEPYLVVAGNMYPIRVKLLERLMAKGIPLKLYGDGIPRWTGDTPIRQAHTGHPIFRDEKARIYRSAAGVLNSMNPAEIMGVNARVFEAAGCGAAVLCEFRPKLPELFDIEREIFAFGDFDQLVDQATRLLNEPGLTTRLGDAAARRAHSEHTYDNRLSAILDQLT